MPDMDNIGEVDGYCFELWCNFFDPLDGSIYHKYTDLWVYLGDLDEASIIRAVEMIGHELAVRARPGHYLSDFVTTPDPDVRISPLRSIFCDFTPKHQLRGHRIKIRQPGVISLLH